MSEADDEPTAAPAGVGERVSTRDAAAAREAEDELSGASAAERDGVSTRDAAAAREADPVAVAREIALRQLTVRARSRAELAKALARKNVPDDVAEQVLVRLEEVGLIDDEVFARDWLAAGARRQKSRRVLLGELSEKGVARELIDQAAADLNSARDYEVALAFATRKAMSMAGLDPAVRYRRLAGALARRGFPSSVVAQVIREALAELADPDEFD